MALRLLFCGTALAALLAGAQDVKLQTVRQVNGATTQYMVVMPHLPFGMTWNTTMLLRNEGSADAAVQVLYYGRDGNPKSVPLTTGAATQTNATIPAHGQVVIATDPNSTVPDDDGWAALVFESTEIKAQGVFFWKSATPSEAVAPVVSQLANCIIPLPALGGASMPFDNTGTSFSGYGVTNPSSAATTMQAQAYDNTGALIGSYTENLAGFGHTAFLLTTAIPASVGKSGIVVFSSGMAPLGFKFTQGGARFTTWQP